jgi:6-phosphogluconolactonase (cycloisomerase 2 family)
MSRKLSALSALAILCAFAITIAGCNGIQTTTASDSNTPGTVGTGNNNPGSTRPSGVEILYEAFTPVPLPASSSGIRGFSVNPANGTLHLLPNAAVSEPVQRSQGISVDPADKLLFDAHTTDNVTFSVTVYQINGNTGGLTQSADNPISSTIAWSPRFHPNDKFLYVLDSNNIVGFSFDASGKLTPLPGFPVATGTVVDSMDIDPKGTFLYVGSSENNNVVGFSINQTSGALTMLPEGPVQVRSFTPCGCPNKNFTGITIRFDPTAQFLFIGDAGNGAMTSWAVDQNTGAITKVATAPDRLGADEIAVTPNGKFLYDVGFGSACCNISGFVVGPGGTLVPMPAQFPVPITPFEDFIVTGILIDPSGNFLYQVNNSGTFSGYVINQTAGILTANGQEFTDALPNSIAIIK